MRRIGDQYGVQFDVPGRDLTIVEGTSDTVPVVHGFSLKPKKGLSVLDISFGKRPMNTMAIDPGLSLSTHVQKRSILNATGQSIGEDYWGYLKTGERWREAQFFQGGVVAKYQFVDRKDAELFDRVISSACVIPAPQS